MPEDPSLFFNVPTTHWFSQVATTIFIYISPSTLWSMPHVLHHTTVTASVISSGIQCPCLQVKEFRVFHCHMHRQWNNEMGRIVLGRIVRNHLIQSWYNSGVCFQYFSQQGPSFVTKSFQKVSALKSINYAHSPFSQAPRAVQLVFKSRKEQSDTEWNWIEIALWCDMM